MNLPERILFIGAHCDDIELLAGGTLARACSEGRRVGVLVFSDHRGVVDDATAEQAAGEFRANLAWLMDETGTRIVDHSGVMLPACSGAFEKQRSDIYAAMEALRDDYDAVITHVASDTNQDHRQVAAEARRVFKAHASLLGGEFPNNDLGEFSAQVFVPLSERDVAAKVGMIQRYRSQDFGGRPYLDEDVVRSLSRLRGSQIRMAAAEAFAVGGRLVVRPVEDG